MKESQKDKRKKISWSKISMLFLFVNCTLVEIFTGYVTIVSLQLAKQIGLYDFTPLVTLIGAIVGETVGFAVYCAKSAKENTEGGIIYEQALRDKNNLSEEKENEDY